MVKNVSSQLKISCLGKKCINIVNGVTRRGEILKNTAAESFNAKIKIHKASDGDSVSEVKYFLFRLCYIWTVV